MTDDEKRKQEICQKLVTAFSQFKRLRISDDTSRFADKKSKKHPDLKHSEFMLLLAISELTEKNPGGVSVSELSGYLNVKTPSITPTFTSLEQKELILRAIDPNDRRIIRITLTEKGKKITEESFQHFTNYMKGVVDYLGEEKSNQFADILNDIYQYALTRKHDSNCK